MLARLLISLALLPGTPYVASAQEIPPADREKLRQAQRTADHFVERFERTLDFGAVWREFQLSDSSCNYKLNGPLRGEDYERLKLSDALVERLYLAYMNCFYLASAYRLSLARIIEGADNDLAVEKLMPKEIRDAERKLSDIEVRDEGRPRPQNAKEVEVVVAELQHLARVWRKHMPRNLMRSAILRANVKYLLSRDDGISNLGVGRGHANFCIPDHVKYYIVDRGLFYFYFTEQKGHMKVAGFGIGR